MTFSPNGKLLVFAMPPDSLALWNPNNAKQLAIMRQPYPSMVLDVAFSPDSQVLVTCGGGMNVQPLGMGIRGGPGPHGFTATGNSESVVDFWDTLTHKVRHTQKMKEFVMGVAFSPDGKLLAAVGIEKLLVFDVAAGTLRQTIGGGGDKVAFSDDGKSVVTVSFHVEPASVSVADLASGRSKTTIKKLFRDVVEPAAGPFRRWPLGGRRRQQRVARRPDLRHAQRPAAGGLPPGRQRPAAHLPAHRRNERDCADGRTLATARAHGPSPRRFPSMCRNKRHRES